MQRENSFLIFGKKKKRGTFYKEWERIVILSIKKSDSFFHPLKINMI